ncbi:MAG: MotA/TolQ/ExbB proton channel family protein [Verrucomicrobiae bacterium]|nr:MotA/TolQ/ExbB proton channel family protein [Verrucomicrobiae bacterium]
MKTTKLAGVTWTLLLPAMALAQQAAAPVQPYESKGMTLWQIVQEGGWVLAPLVLISIVGMAMVIYYFLTLRHDKIVDPSFVEGCRRLLRDRRFDRVEALCGASARPIATILRAALDARATSGPTEVIAVREAAEAEGERQAAALWDQIHYLMDIVVVAPMIGLLGTVIGMIRSFSGLALDISAAKPILLAQGVAQALTCTALGLCVAIPAAIFYAYFRGRVNKLTLEMESASTELVNRLISAEMASNETTVTRP